MAMRRLWAAGAAMVVCLALGGLPALAQDGADPAAPVADPGAEVDPDPELGRAGWFVTISSLIRFAGGAVDPVLGVVAARFEACTSEPAGDPLSACVLDVVREFRFAGDLTADSRAASAITWLLKRQCQRLTGMPAAACRGVLGELSECSSLKDDFERDLCQGYVIDAHCEIPTEAEKTTQACLFERAMAAGSLVACALLKDADARHLCEARVSGSEASCQKLSRPDLVKRCRKALRDGTTPSIEWLAGDKAKPGPEGPAKPEGPAEPEAPGSEEENPCADADPNDPICGMQNP
jgi:hypothetical protein